MAAGSSVLTLGNVGGSVGGDLAMMNCSDAQFFIKKDVIRISVGITCVFSMIGAVLIMASFLCFKTMRSPTRFILFNIALSDFFVGFSNFAGDVGNFNAYYINWTIADASLCHQSEYYNIFHSITPSMQITPSALIRNLCVGQATIALYSTLSSVLWTMALAVYLYFSITSAGTKMATLSLRFSFVFSYGVPLFLTLWMYFTKKLGYSPYNAASWCTLIVYDPVTYKVDKYLAIFGYDLWIYLTMFMTVVLYVGIRLYLADQAKKTSHFVSQKKFWDAVHTMDYKFMLVPVFFLLLRIWSCIMNMLMYADVNLHRLPWELILALEVLSGIGDSGQGMINGILFVLMIKTVRQQMLNAICCKWRKISFTLKNNSSSLSYDERSNKSIGPDERTPFLSSHEEINNP